jgi:hypothetical protein
MVGQKNWLLSDTVKGAVSSTTVYKLVEIAKLNGLEPYEYLRKLMQELPWFGSQPRERNLEDSLLGLARIQVLTRASSVKDL